MTDQEHADAVRQAAHDFVKAIDAALIVTREPTKGPGCGAIDCVNACDGEFTHETCPNAIAARAR